MRRSPPTSIALGGARRGSDGPRRDMALLACRVLWVKGDQSAAGRALQKHGGRPGSVYPRINSPADRSRIGEELVEDDLTHPQTRERVRRDGARIFELPDGRGVSFRLQTRWKPPRISGAARMSFSVRIVDAEHRPEVYAEIECDEELVAEAYAEQGHMQVALLSRDGRPMWAAPGDEFEVRLRVLASSSRSLVCSNESMSLSVRPLWSGDVMLWADSVNSR